MNPYLDILLSPDMFVVVIGALCGVGLWIGGPARPSSLDLAKRRATGLTPFDFMIGVFMVVFGVFLAQTVIETGSAMMLQIGLGGSPPAPGTERFGAGLRMVAQIAMLGPAIGFIVFETRLRSGIAGLYEFGILTTRPIRDLGVGVVAALVSLPMVLGLILIVTWIGEFAQLARPQGPSHPVLQEISQSHDLGAVGFLAASAILVAPFTEEAVFRGLVQTGLRTAWPKAGGWPVVLTAALLFATVHNTVSWQALPGLFLLGVVLGWLYERTGSLWPGIVTHAGFNLANVLLTMLTGKG